jgi:hypothetical protein
MSVKYDMATTEIEPLTFQHIEISMFSGIMAGY